MVLAKPRMWAVPTRSPFLSGIESSSSPEPGVRNSGQSWPSTLQHSDGTLKRPVVPRLNREDLPMPLGPMMRQLLPGSRTKPGCRGALRAPTGGSHRARAASCRLGCRYPHASAHLGHTIFLHVLPRSTVTRLKAY